MHPGSPTVGKCAGASRRTLTVFIACSGARSSGQEVIRGVKERIGEMAGAVVHIVGGRMRAARARRTASDVLQVVLEKAGGSQDGQAGISAWEVQALSRAQSSPVDLRAEFTSVDRSVDLVSEYVCAILRWGGRVNCRTALEGVPSRPRVLLVGALVKDLFLRVERMPMEGCFASVLATEGSYGGNGANAASCFRALGCPTTFCTQATARDVDGLRAALREDGVTVELMEPALNSNPAAHIYWCGRESLGYFIPGSPYSATELPIGIESFDIVYLAGPQVLLKAAYQSLRSCQVRPYVHWDVGYGGEVEASAMAKMLGIAEGVTANREETRRILDASRGMLISKWPGVFTETRGENGCRAYWRGVDARFPAPSAEVLTAFGAGDHFGAAMAFARWAGWSVFESCGFASRIATAPLHRVIAHGGVQEVLDVDMRG